MTQLQTSNIIKSLFQSGLHLGHPIQDWNPQMQHFIQKNKPLMSVKKKQTRIHTFDLVKTASHLAYLCSYFTKAAKQNKKILFVGTESGHSTLIARAAKACNTYYINEKWLGGMLTNWQTVNLSKNRLKTYDTLISTNQIKKMPKKEVSKILKQQSRLQKVFGGIKSMSEKPDVVLILGQLKEKNALKECRKLNITCICLVDSNCSPVDAPLILPTNDDSPRSIQTIFSLLVYAFQRGKLLSQPANASKIKSEYVWQPKKIKSLEIKKSSKETKSNSVKSPTEKIHIDFNTKTAKEWLKTKRKKRKQKAVKNSRREGKGKNVGESSKIKSKKPKQTSLPSIEIQQPQFINKTEKTQPISKAKTLDNSNGVSKKITPSSSIKTSPENLNTDQKNNKVDQPLLRKSKRNIKKLMSSKQKSKKTLESFSSNKSRSSIVSKRKAIGINMRVKKRPKNLFTSKGALIKQTTMFLVKLLEKQQKQHDATQARVLQKHCKNSDSLLPAPKWSVELQKKYARTENSTNEIAKRLLAES